MNRVQYTERTGCFIIVRTMIRLRTIHESVTPKKRILSRRTFGLDTVFQVLSNKLILFDVPLSVTSHSPSVTVKSGSVRWYIYEDVLTGIGIVHFVWTERFGLVTCLNTLDYFITKFNDSKLPPPFYRFIF